jgi:glucose-1-phosphate adenylyltransferase
MNKILTIILAGGRGERMGNLCRSNKKPVLPVAGNLKLIDFCLSNCLHSRVKQIGVINSGPDDGIAQYVSNWSASCNGRLNIRPLPPLDGPYTGTADAVWQNAPFIKRSNAEFIIVMAADHVYRMDYSKLIKFHIAMKADMTLAVSTVPVEEASRYGIVTAHPDGRVMEFREKPAAPCSNLVSMGIYIFSRDILLKCLADDAMSKYSAHDFGYSIIPRLLDTNRVFTYRFNGYWQDIGTIESYYRTNLDLIDKLPLFKVSKRWPVLGNTGTVLSAGEHNVIHSLVSPGCVIKGRVENSVLSPGVIINEKAVVKDSIIMSGTSIGEYGYITDSIIQENVATGEFCNIGIKGDQRNNEPALTIIGPGITVPSFTTIYRGDNVIRNS